MLRHSRAETYVANKKYKERDRNHTGDKVYFEQTTEDYLKKRRRFSLRQYLKNAWGINI